MKRETMKLRFMVPEEENELIKAEWAFSHVNYNGEKDGSMTWETKKFNGIIFVTITGTWKEMFLLRGRLSDYGVLRFEVA